MKRIEVHVKGEAEIARMQRGDVLLVKFKGRLGLSDQDIIKQALERRLPEGVHVLLADETVELSILRPGSDEPLPLARVDEEGQAA